MRSDSWRNPRSALKFGAWILLLAVTWVFYIDLCGFYFQCGCKSLWAGGTAQCNIHHPGMKHCPLCLIPTIGYGALVASVLIAQSHFAWRGKWLWAIILFPLLTGIQALALGWYRGYWS